MAGEEADRSLRHDRHRGQDDHRDDRHNGHHHHKRKRSKRNRFEIGIKAQWVLFSVVFVLAVALVIITQAYYKTDGSDGPTPHTTPDTLIVTVDNEAGQLIKSAVQKFLSMDIMNSANAEKLPSSFSSGNERLDVQVPVTLNVSVKEGVAMLYKIELADNEQFENATTAYIDAGYGSYDCKYLCVDTTYYYRVTVYKSEGTEMVIGRFKTADTPRILSIDGLTNVRDIGNWPTDSGKKIKQGLLIRGAEMDGAVESDYCLTSQSLLDMREVLGIKTDMDLRAQTATSRDALGACVEHMYYDMVQYEDIFTEVGKERIRALFSDLADPDNYPIYLHCTYGLDRTGTVCYLLEALLGVSRGDCLRDYGLSDRMKIASIQTIEEGLENYNGTTLKEQTESYLLSCGVSEGQISSIRRIFLGD